MSSANPDPRGSSAAMRRLPIPGPGQMEISPCLPHYVGGIGGTAPKSKMAGFGVPGVVKQPALPCIPHHHFSAPISSSNSWAIAASRAVCLHHDNHSIFQKLLQFLGCWGTKVSTASKSWMVISPPVYPSAGYGLPYPLSIPPALVRFPDICRGAASSGQPLWPRHPHPRPPAGKSGGRE